VKKGRERVANKSEKLNVHTADQARKTPFRGNVKEKPTLRKNQKDRTGKGNRKNGGSNDFHGRQFDPSANYGPGGKRCTQEKNGKTKSR